MTAKIEFLLTATRGKTTWVAAIPSAKIFKNGVAANPHEALMTAKAAAEELLAATGFIAVAAIA